MSHGTRVLVAVVVVMFVVLIVGVPLSLYEQNQSAIHREAQSLCLSGNDYRMQDAELWHFILNAFPSPPVGSVERTRLDQFLAFLAVHDKQRDCSKL